MAERSGYFLPGLVKGLLAAIAAIAIALSAAQAQSTCTADSNCTGVDEACVFGRCLQVSYNADWECEKPYYLLPDGDSADEGYVVLRDALAKSKKVAIGQLIMHGREHLVGIAAHKKGLMLVILRYQDELRKPEPYFDSIETNADADAVTLAVNLIEQEAGKFEPEKMPNEYARAIHELVRAKVEQRAPEVEIETEKREAPKVVNIMDALKKSMQAKGQTKVRDSVRKRMDKAAAKGQVSPAAPRSRPTTRRTAH